MAEPVFITCPECNKRFKGRRDLEGRRIRCPLCSEPFLVELDDEPAPRSKSKPPPLQEKKPRQVKKESAPPPPPPAPEPVAAAPKSSSTTWDEEDDDGGNPYTAQETKLQARCPNCAKEMLSEKAVVCVYCGYNTLTREIGRTQKTFAVTGKQHFMHLLPGLAAVVFAILQIISAMYYCIVLPYSAAGTWYAFTDSEAMRMWTVIFALMDTWPPALYAYNRLIINPKPKEVAKE